MMSFYSFATIALSVILVSATFIYLYLQYVFSYWKRRGIRHLKPIIPFGNIKELVLGRTNFGSNMADLYPQVDGPYAGFYMSIKPSILIKDPELIKKFLVKDFNFFPDRGIYYNEIHDPMSANMFALRGQKWKTLRNKITPTFTSGKMKMMFHTIETVGQELDKCLDSLCDSDKPVDFKDLFARFTTDIIGSCVFGLECNSLKNPEAHFKQQGDKFIRSTLSNTIVLVAGLIVPDLLTFFNFKVTNKESSEFFLKVLEENIKHREDNDVHRKDFMDLFIRLKNNENITDEALIIDSKFEKHSSNDGVTFLELAAQAFVFFIAGYETSSTTSSVCLTELARNMEIQKKVRKEINDTLKKHGALTYEAVMDMKYLDQVVNETLRKYPIAPNLIRVCREKCQFTDDLEIEKGTMMWVPVLGLHMDPKYYPDPEKFDPERFTEAEKSKRLPFTYLPFGEGPRMCIGNRFALLQTKMALISVLRKHCFYPVRETKIQWTKKGVLLFPENEIFLKPARANE